MADTTERADKPTVTMYVSELIRALKVAAHFAATDTINNSLRYVGLEAGAGAFTATSTNRYVAAHTRGGANGELPRVWIRRDYVESIVAFLEPLAADVSHNALQKNVYAFLKVRLTLTGARVLTVAFEAGPDIFTVQVKVQGDWAGRDAWPFDDPEMVASTFGQAKDGYDGMRLDGACMVNLEHLAPLAGLLRAGKDDFHWPTLRFSFTGPAGPVRVEHGGWMLLAVMPVRMRAEDGTLRPVPYGLRVAQQV